ncbi:MAG: helix-turn-helix domain-containing protein [Candidatus Pacearchaeota archaeon]|jgi:sugar-specific transcriptional regulator TrmB
MDIYEKLQQAGLTGNEAKAYLELLKQGELSANQIAKNISMDRTLTYTVLNHLIEKGQISYIIKQNKKIFSCSNPENLLNPIKTKETLILGLIKELKTIKPEQSEKTEINVYEGKEGMRALMNEIIKCKEFFAFGGTGRAYDLLYEMSAMAKQLEKTKASAKVIMGKEYQGHEFTKYKAIEVKFADIKSEATTTIFEDKISIHLIKDKPIIIIIKNKDIAQSYRNYFNYMWKKEN